MQPSVIIFQSERKDCIKKEKVVDLVIDYLQTLQETIIRVMILEFITGLQ